MRKLLQTAFFFSVFFIFVAGASAKMPGADPAELWEYITEKAPYTSWGFWADHEGLQEGSAPHAPLHKVYVNELGLKSVHAPASNGTIVVKENIGTDKELKALTVMYKIKGYNPEAGDWFWVKYDPKGNVAKSGKPKGCISCHSSADDNDYILVHEFK